MREMEGPVRGLGFGETGPRQGMPARVGMALGERVSNEDVDRVAILGVDEDEGPCRAAACIVRNMVLVVDLDRLLVGEEELEARDALLASFRARRPAFGTDRSLTAMWNPTSMTGGFLLSFSRQLSRTWKNVSPLYWMQKSTMHVVPPQAAATVPDVVVAGRQPLVVRVEMSVGIDEAGQDQFSVASISTSASRVRSAPMSEMRSPSTRTSAS